MSDEISEKKYRTRDGVDVVVGDAVFMWKQMLNGQALIGPTVMEGGEVDWAGSTEGLVSECYSSQKAATVFGRTVSYDFEVCGDPLSADEIDVMPNRGNLQMVRIEETRKNGQEDCHMCGYLVRESADVPWRWDDLEIGAQLFDEYGNDGLSAGILQVFNSVPFPPRIFVGGIRW